MAKTFTLDLGTASIGFSLRDTDLGNSITEQLSNFGSIIFKTTVNKDGKGNFKSLATNRREKRSPRRLYQARKYRIWETLKVLIDPANKTKKDDEIDLDKRGIFCPLTMRELNRWRKYDILNGLKRQYPADVECFEQWVRMDFDADGIADYSSPYQLRAELATTQLDFSLGINRYKLGRALYHIAQRRGFKSSKGETLKDQEDAIKETVDAMIDFEIVSLKKSEEKKSSNLTTYMIDNKLPTIGCAFAKLEQEGVRIRASIYQAVRSQYKDEIKYIFDFQCGLDNNSDLFNKIFSDRKEGSIFYKRPLRSQKGLVGKCTLEPTKSRCPISHPEFEKFRAFTFINNIQYRKTIEEEWQNLTPERKLNLYKGKFLLTKSTFKFEEIRQWIEKEIGTSLSKEQSVTDSTINYSDRTNVAGCPVSGRLRNLLGDNWEKFLYKTSGKRKEKNGEEHTVTYSWEDIWHICFSFDDEEAVAEFAKSKLQLDDKQAKSLINLWVAIPQGYSMLSLNAIRNINKFLVPKIDNELYKGFIYTESALLGKLPKILGDDLWKVNEKEILESISSWIDSNRDEKRNLKIVNTLISNYKSEIDERPVYQSSDKQHRNDYKNIEYQLDDIDKKEIKKYTIEAIGEKTWGKLAPENKDKILAEIGNKYQQFFSTSKRDYFRLPKLGDTIKLYLSNNFPALHCESQLIDPKSKLPCQCLACKRLNRLYHPSMVEFYKPAKEQTFEYNGFLLSKKLLESPIIGAFKNPMAMRTLHELRKLINYFIKEGIIDEETRIVVETARELNDTNMRWAIEEYQREREKENKEIAKAIKELHGEETDGDDIEKARLLIEQHPDYIFDKDRYIVEKEYADTNLKKKKIIGQAKVFQYKKDITKYRLWLEQGMQCIYTGKIININNLFNETSTDFEHTIPRSLSFDNSFANLTICDSYYNRHIKKNRIPTQLENYDKNAIIEGQLYSAIKPRLEKWEQKVEQIRNNVEFWKQKSKQSQIKETKDYNIRQRHLWQMELDYWQNKLDRFTRTEVTSGFKSSQLVDTRLITKYAYHYLKSVFNKVVVQKGTITADFRKMLGVQSVDEKKSRDKHSHHAIDAVILSLIPGDAKRDRMLELFYKIQEEKKLNHEIDNLQYELNKEIAYCKIGNISNLSQYIEDNILVNHICKDQTLTPVIRKVRKRGKVIWLRDENREIKIGETGKGLPKYYIKGDCIRGQLHGETFYGAITQAKKDKTGAFLRDDDGKMVIDNQVIYVIRKELKYKKNTQDSGFASLPDLETKIVDKDLYLMIEKQCENKSFKDVCEEGFYMIDKNGNKVNRIRHIRCFADTKNPIIIKQHSHLSNKSYKQNYYATNGENILYGLYRDKEGNTDFECISLFNAAKIMKTEDLKDGTGLFPLQKIKGKNILDFVFMLKPGTRVILRDEENSFSDLNDNEIMKRLYVVTRLYDPNRGNIQLQYHLEARDNKLLTEAFPNEVFGKKGINGFSFPDFENPLPRLLLDKSKLFLWVEGKDFDISHDGRIKKI